MNRIPHYSTTRRLCHCLRGCVNGNAKKEEEEVLLLVASCSSQQIGHLCHVKGESNKKKCWGTDWHCRKWNTIKRGRKHSNTTLQGSGANKVPTHRKLRTETCRVAGRPGIEMNGRCVESAAAASSSGESQHIWWLQITFHLYSHFIPFNSQILFTFSPHLARPLNRLNHIV